jgi:phosphoribosylpyrophosphate synthetase
MNPGDAGDGLRALLEAQGQDAAAVTFPALEVHAAALISLGRRWNNPIVWPVGSAAERIAGAAALLSSGELRLREWNRDVQGERVLIFTVVAVTPLALIAAAQQALNMGAASVEACGVHVEHLSATGLGPLANLHALAGAVLAGTGV